MTEFFEDIKFNRTFMVLVGSNSPTVSGFFTDALRTTFCFDKSLEKTPNSGSVEIYNLSRKSRRNIEQRAADVLSESKDNNLYIPSLEFRAGYRGNDKTVFLGTITNITTRKNGPDIVTTIEAADGFAAYQDAKINTAYASGAKAGQLIEDIAASMGLKAGAVVGFDVLNEYLKGVTFSGAARDALSKLLKKQGLEWSIQDNKIQILPPNTPTTNPPIELSRNTGLIGAPYRTWFLNDTALTRKSTDDIKSGLYGTCLLNPEIIPGQLLVIKPPVLRNSDAQEDLQGPPDQETFGLVRVIKCRHYGDTHGNPWYTDFVAE